MVDALSKHGKIKADKGYEGLIDVLEQADEHELVEEIKELMEKDKERKLQAEKLQTDRARSKNPHDHGNYFTS